LYEDVESNSPAAALPGILYFFDNVFFFAGYFNGRRRLLDLTYQG
jgi:hypothetical protein